MAELSGETSLLRIVGKGPSFPFRFSSSGGTRSVSITEGTLRINESIRVILSTRLGERVGRPTFGSRLPELAFEPNDDILLPMLNRETHIAIATWEKRISVKRISFIGKDGPITEDEDEIYLNALRTTNEIGIFIDYLVLRTHQPGSYVHPFVRKSLPL